MNNGTSHISTGALCSDVFPSSSAGGVSLDSIYFYLTVFCFGLFAQIFLGFYLSDVLVLLYIGKCLLTGRLRHTKRFLSFVTMAAVLLFFPAIFSLMVQILFLDAPISNYSFYIPYNFLLGSLYIVFMFQIVEKINIYPSMLLAIFAIPVVWSFAAYLYPPLQVPLEHLYHIDYMYRQTDPFTVRFGGIFGFDVNQLGYYSTLVIILALFFNFRYRISKIIFYSVLLMSLYCSLISGMRLGLYLLVPLIFVLFFVGKVKVLSNFDILFLFFSGLIPILLMDTSDVLISIINRFGVEMFLNDLLSGDAHVSGMYVKWFKIMIVQNNDILSLLFACYPEWKHPDSFIIFLLGNGGIIGLFCLFIFYFLLGFKILFQNCPKKYKWFLFAILVFNFGTGLKGNYPLNNGGMFIFSFIVTALLLKKEGLRQLRDKF
ncbi:MAG: hypothetical protein L3J57_13155 [Desulfuromusa sp.]|nr:hypothetical protein [Desulfuromusa sp.]